MTFLKFIWAYFNEKKNEEKYRVTPRVLSKNNVIFIKCIIDQNFWSFLYFLLKIGHQVPFITLHVKKSKNPFNFVIVCYCFIYFSSN